MKKLLFVILLPLFASCSQTQAPQNHVSTVIFDTTEECQKDIVNSTTNELEDSTSIATKETPKDDNDDWNCIGGKAYYDYDPNDPKTLIWNKKYKMYNATVMDKISTPSDGEWELVFGVTQKDIKKGDHWWSAIIFNSTQNKKYILPRREAIDAPHTNTSVDRELLGATGTGLLSHSMYNGFPRYVFFDGNETGTDNYVYVFDFKTKSFKRLCPGTIQKVIPSDFLLISQLLIDYKEYYDGDKYLGMKCVDKIITPTGDVIWKGDVYNR